MDSAVLREMALNSASTGKSPLLGYGVGEEDLPGLQVHELGEAEKADLLFQRVGHLHRDDVVLPRQELHL